MKKILIGIILFFVFFSAALGHAYAATVPTFPTCVNPQGTQSVSYDSGTHGIVGDTATHTGSDTVYTLSSQSLMQCFCDLNGSGTQTNWMKASSYSADDISVLESQGWMFVPDGSAWGLDPVAYLAQNNSYSCQGASTNGGSSSSNGGSSPSNSSSSNSSSSNGSTGNILAASTGPTLAYTGNMAIILGLFGLGIFAMLSGFALSFDKQGVKLTIPYELSKPSFSKKLHTRKFTKKPVRSSKKQSRKTK